MIINGTFFVGATFPPNPAHAGAETVLANRGLLSLWVAVSLIILLIPVSQYSYLLFHTLVELFSVIIAACMLVVAWSAYPFARNGFLLFLGFGFFWVGALDLVHTLLYKGMQVYPVVGANPATQFWVAARYLQALLLLAAPLFLSRPVRRGWTFWSFGIAAAALYALIMGGGFPDAYIEGRGLTPFKIWSEYVIIGLLAASALHLWRRRALADSRVVALMLWSIALTMGAELAFTFYVGVYDLSNLIGHLFKLFAYWLIYLALIEFTLARPFRAMARQAHTYDAVPEPICMVDREAIVHQLNSAARLAARLGADEGTGRECHALFHPPELSREQCPVCQRIRRGEPVQNLEMAFAGAGRWHEITLSPIAWGDSPAGMVHVSRDITERKLQEQKIGKLSRIRAFSSEINAAIVRIHKRQALFEETCRIASEHGKFEMVWIASLDSEKQEVRPLAWTGFSPETAHAVSWAIISAARGTLGEAILTRRPTVRNDIEAELPTGKLRQEALKAGCRSTVCMPLVVDDNVVALIVLFATERGFFDEDELALLNELTADVSFALQSIARQEKVEYLSYYDTLTGLPNRQLFIDRLSQQVQARSGESPMVALILFDLERFRNINESLGRHGGDDLLKLVARRFERAFHGKDHLARVSSDSFGVMMRGVKDAASVAHIIENQVQGCFTEPFTVGGKELRMAARIGVALFPADGGDTDTLFTNAEVALKKAKGSGERYLFYAAEMNARVAQALSLETRLRKAVEAQQFVLHYQPKIELATGRVCGLEALIRWQDPESGLVVPGAFIPLLEETGLIFEVGRWALARALEEYKEWTARGRTVPRIAVNVCAIQLQQKDFVDIVTSAVQQAGDLPHALEFEITESLLMKDVETTIRKLSTLRELGIQIAMDDFGTGYSSLSYLARLPIDTVKIDRSFVGGMAGGADAMAIVTTIIALAHSLNLRVVAEGVETEEQAQLLRLLKCDEAQGYLFSRPLPAAEVEEKFGAGAAPVCSR